MVDKRTVFILGAGASCPYGYPSGAHLREYICLFTNRPGMSELVRALDSEKDLGNFRKKFENSSTRSIDLFMARNPRLAAVGKCIIAFETLKAEGRSKFRERAEWEQERHEQHRDETSINSYVVSKDFQGGDWYSYLFDRLTIGSVGKDHLPDFSQGNVAFITFNYDRSLEYFLYESFRNSFTEVPEAHVIDCLKSLKILHVYGQIAPLKWQDCAQGTDYRPQITTALLQNVSSNIRTIYEEQKSPQLADIRALIKATERIFFLGFGYAPENMNLLDLHGNVQEECWVYGTVYGLEQKEIEEIRNRLIVLRPGGHTDRNIGRTVIDNMDCLKLLRNYL